MKSRDEGMTSIFLYGMHPVSGGIGSIPGGIQSPILDSPFSSLLTIYRNMRILPMEIPTNH